jgi:hypothetical protein
LASVPDVGFLSVVVQGITTISIIGPSPTLLSDIHNFQVEGYAQAHFKKLQQERVKAENKLDRRSIHDVALGKGPFFVCMIILLF